MSLSYTFTDDHPAGVNISLDMEKTKALDLIDQMIEREEYIDRSQTDKGCVHPPGDSWTVHHLKLLKDILTGN